MAKHAPATVTLLSGQSTPLLPVPTYMGWESRFSDQENVLKMYPQTSYFQAE